MLDLDTKSSETTFQYSSGLFKAVKLRCAKRARIHLYPDHFPNDNIRGFCSKALRLIIALLGPYWQSLYYQRKTNSKEQDSGFLVVAKASFTADFDTERFS